ncbi:hypothetical protein HMPREF0239_02506 [Clostridium sp. ATCC BAA-442]|nr:hypothetical protein HMPREF0239_02506 [Clostridium sp. ATCC BAA-442]
MINGKPQGIHLSGIKITERPPPVNPPAVPAFFTICYCSVTCPGKPGEL